MYGLVDAPRAWYLEARERLTSLGAMVHPLDSCLFMVYDDAAQSQILPDSSSEASQMLVAIFGIHVDDILGCCNPNSPRWQSFQTSLKKTFEFRTWDEATPQKGLEYCGVTVAVPAGMTTLSQETYIKKQHPISFKDPGDAPRPVTEAERSALRALIAGLQWLATQTAPHL